LGIIAARCEGADAWAVHAEACGAIGWAVSGWAAGRRAAQDGLDARRGGRRSGPWRQQAILGRGRWDADALRDVVRDYVVETLGAEDALLVIDETGFLKQGKGSCGVARQYTGSAGKITNCQIGVFAAYVSQHGHAFIDRALYLPKRWTSDPARMAKTHVPTDMAFATKPALAVQMITRAIGADVPFAWVAADSVYGVGDIEQALRRAGKGYVLGVSSNHHFGSWVGKPAMARRGQGCTTGRIMNSPTCMPTNMSRAAPVCRPGVY